LAPKLQDDIIKNLTQLYQRKLQAAHLSLNLALPDSKFQEAKDVHWTFPGGAYYKDEIANGKRHGYGIGHFPNGDHFEGNFVGKLKGYDKYV